jgi:hypothetical protein
MSTGALMSGAAKTGARRAVMRWTGPGSSGRAASAVQKLGDLWRVRSRFGAHGRDRADGDNWQRHSITAGSDKPGEIDVDDIAMRDGAARIQPRAGTDEADRRQHRRKIERWHGHGWLAAALAGR